MNMKRKKDWHKADIIAALHKKHLSLASLSRDNGLNSNTLNNALLKAWPKGELIIATALKLHPSEIWPTRYFNEDGTPIKRTLRHPINKT
ncbi:helix-turn-helix domain-containing protein [Escherichia coli]|nr:helix-turn-helix domain-containing protein [Escherichia coli]